MAIEGDLKLAERTGITISKEKLIQVIRDAARQQFAVAQGQNSSYVIVPVVPKK